MEYVIISLESRNLIPEGEVLYIKANPVKDAGESFRHVEEMFGKKYYNYSMMECSETDYFILPFSESDLQRFISIAKRTQNPQNYDSFWSPNMHDFHKVEMKIEDTGKITEVYEHKNLYKPLYSFIPVSDIVYGNINGDEIFVIDACKRLNGAPFYDKPEDYIPHHFVYAASERNRYMSEIQEARQQNKRWTPDLRHFVKESITIKFTDRFTGEPGQEERDLYISRKLSYPIIMENLNKLPLF